MTTIRALMLAQQERHRNIVNGIGVECGCAEGCASPWPCPDRVAADAVLATLDAAEKTRRGWIDMGGFDEYRLVPDPGAS